MDQKFSGGSGGMKITWPNPFPTVKSNDQTLQFFSSWKGLLIRT